MENAELKKELKKCQDLLAIAQRKVTTLAVERTTEESLSAAAEDGGGNEQVKCTTCDFSSRNKVLFDSHMQIQHGPKTRHVCNACNKKCSTNDELELHLVEKHQDEIDCLKCNAVFKTEDDVYQHTADCNELIPYNTCDKCKKNVISKSALKKHNKSCKGIVPSDICRNGDQCRWFRNNRCSFVHNDSTRNQQSRQQPRKERRPNQPRRQQPTNDWQTAQPRVRQPLWTCRFCDANIHSREAGRNHMCEMHPAKSVNVQIVEMRRRQESTHGPAQRGRSDRPQLWCKFQDKCLKGQACGFKHIGRDFLERILHQNQH